MERLSSLHAGDLFLASACARGDAAALDPRAEGFPILRESREARVNTVMSNSFGFGGTNGTLVFAGV